MSLEIGPRMLPEYVKKIFDNGWVMQWHSPVVTRNEFEQRVFRAQTSRDNHMFQAVYGNSRHIFFDRRDDNKWLLFYEASPQGIQQLKWKVDPRVLNYLLISPRDIGVKAGLHSTTQVICEPVGQARTNSGASISREPSHEVYECTGRGVKNDIPEDVCSFVGGKYVKLELSTYSEGIPWQPGGGGYNGSTAGHGSREVIREATSTFPISQCIVEMSKSPGYNNWDFRVPKHLKHHLTSYWE
jgi:hypothetical protein